MSLTFTHCESRGGSPRRAARVRFSTFAKAGGRGDTVGDEGCLSAESGGDGRDDPYGVEENELLAGLSLVGVTVQLMVRRMSTVDVADEAK
jgi:hypothetical protein